MAGGLVAVLAGAVMSGVPVFAASPGPPGANLTALAPAAAPVRMPAAAAELSGIARASTSSCIAVGFYTDPRSVQHALAESWNGKSWQVLPVPQGRAYSAELAGVSCPSSRWCVSVDILQRTRTAPLAALIERWTGRAWSIVPAGKTCAQICELNGVSCLSTRACLAVGFGPYGSLAEQWNGRTWRVVLNENQDGGPGGDPSSLSGVACWQDSACLAVGSQEPVTDFSMLSRRPGTVFPGLRSRRPALPDRQDWAESRARPHTTRASSAREKRGPQQAGETLVNPQRGWP